MGDSLRNFTHERCLAEPRLDPRRRRDRGSEMGGVRGEGVPRCSPTKAECFMNQQIRRYLGIFPAINSPGDFV